MLTNSVSIRAMLCTGWNTLGACRTCRHTGVLSSPTHPCCSSKRYIVGSICCSAAILASLSPGFSRRKIATGEALEILCHRNGYIFGSFLASQILQNNDNARSESFASSSKNCLAVTLSLVDVAPTQKMIRTRICRGPKRGWCGRVTYLPPCNSHA